MIFLNHFLEYTLLTPALVQESLESRRLREECFKEGMANCVESYWEFQYIGWESCTNFGKMEIIRDSTIAVSPVGVESSV